MKTVFDVDASIVINGTAEELKKIEVMKKPAWANFVKTSPARERYPVNDNWWYVRAASLLRKMYIFNKPIGTNKLRGFYGGRKNRGHKPERFYNGSGKIIRVILQQLEKAELISPIKEGAHKGRIISKKGKSFLDKVVKNVK